MTPAGIPDSSANSASRRIESEEISEGLITRVHPTANAGAIFHAVSVSGKFHGVTTPTTPTGSQVISASASSPT